MMNKKEFDSLIKEYKQCIDEAQKSIDNLTTIFRKECSHPINKVDIKTNEYDDEYGKWMRSWTDYHYTCTRCGTTLYNVKQQFTDRKGLHDALKNANATEKSPHD